MNFLIIEDDAITAMVLEEMLSEFGSCDVVENGLLGLEKLESKFKENLTYSVIFLDIMLPERSGQDILLDIRNLDEKYNKSGMESTKVIMSTALDDYDNIKKAFNNLCEGYIIKPFDKEKITKALIDLDVLYSDDED
jgi:two-component system chemotaxis response regulator CheY